MPDQPTDAPGAASRAEVRSRRAADADGGAGGEPAPDLAPPARPETISHETDSSAKPAAEEEVAVREDDPFAGAEPRNDWRVAERPAKSWGELLLAGALTALGAAILGGAVVTGLWQSPWAAASATIVLWFGMLLPVVVAFAQARPAGLLRLSGLDVLYGVVLGAGLRVTQGWIAAATGGAATFPSYGLVDGALPTGWWITDGLGAALVAPVVEEFFFRGVVLVALYLVLRRAVGAVVAGMGALLGSTGLFVLLHALTLTISLDGVVALTLLGFTCGLLVLLTGRIWGAVLVHVVFNASYVGLALTGTFFV